MLLTQKSRMDKNHAAFLRRIMFTVPVSEWE